MCTPSGPEWQEVLESASYLVICTGQPAIAAAFAAAFAAAMPPPVARAAAFAAALAAARPPVAVAAALALAAAAACKEDYPWVQHSSQAF